MTIHRIVTSEVTEPKENVIEWKLGLLKDGRPVLCARNPSEKWYEVLCVSCGDVAGLTVHGANNVKGLALNGSMWEIK